jgi:general secretion pathway protein G
VEVQKQDDLRYRWTLSRPKGRVVDEGVELYIASCLAAATLGADPTSRISVTVDGGVLVALIVPNMLKRADDARVTAARTDVTNLMQALKLYKLDNLRYPTPKQGLHTSSPSALA